MKKFLARLLAVVVFTGCLQIPVTFAAGTTIADFSYYDEAAIPEEAINAVGDKDIGYSPSYGVDMKAKLFASVDGENGRKLEWSDKEYITGEALAFVPVMSASTKNPWGNAPYFKVQVSTKGMTSLAFSAKMGGSGKAPSDFVLQYSLDDTEYIDIVSYQISAKDTLEQAFDNVSLPEEVQDQETVYLKILCTSTRNISGDTTGFAGSGSGRLAINNVVVSGEGSGGEGQPLPTPSPTPEPIRYIKDISPDTTYYNAVMLLAEMGLIDSSLPYAPVKAISGAEFSALLSKASGIQGNPLDSETVTFDAAIKQILSYLGYDIILQHTNDSEYRIAEDIGLLNNIDCAFDAPLRTGDAATLIYNAMNAYLVKQISAGTSKEYAQVYENWLDNVHGITKIEGVITDCPFFSEAATSIARVKFTSIYGDEISATGSNASAQALAGRRSVAFFKDAYDTAPEFIYAYKSNRDNSLTVKKGWYNSISRVTTKCIYLSYTDSNAITDTAVIDYNAKFVYNGTISEKLRQKAIAKEEGALKPSHIGRIELVDVNEDDIYDYVFVTNVKDMAVASVDTENFRVSNKLQYTEGTSDKREQYTEIPSIELNPDSKDYRTIFVKADEITPASFSDIKPDSVISVAISSMDDESVESAKVRKVIISDLMTEGDVTETYTEEDDLYVTINGESYRFSKSYYKTYDRGESGEITSVTWGDYGKFYLNYDKRIVYVDKATPAENYGILLSTADERGLSGNKKLHIFLADGNNQVFIVTERQFKIWELPADSNNYPITVKYRLNPTDSKKLIRIDKEVKLEYGGELQYSTKGNRLGSYFLTDSTALFAFNPNASNMQDAENYTVLTLSHLKNKMPYNIDLYDLKYNYTPQAALVYYDFTDPLLNDASVLFVSEQSQVMGEDGIRQTKVVGYNEAGSTELLVDEDIQEKPAVGDIIQYSLSAKGEIQKFEVLCNESSPDQTFNDIFDDAYFALHSTVVSVHQNVLSVKNGYINENYMKSDETKVYSIYPSNNGYNVYEDDFYNIIQGNKVFVCQRDGYLTAIFVWKQPV